MPIYEFQCDKSKCKKKEDVLCSFEEIVNNTPICPTHKVAMKRVYSAPSIVTGTQGQRELLQKKQNYKKTRSRAHFKNTVLPTLTDKDSKRHFEKKFKNTKKIDHEKMK